MPTVNRRTLDNEYKKSVWIIHEHSRARTHQHTDLKIFFFSTFLKETIPVGSANIDGPNKFNKNFLGRMQTPLVRVKKENVDEDMMVDRNKDEAAAAAAADGLFTTTVKKEEDDMMMMDNMFRQASSHHQNNKKTKKLITMEQATKQEILMRGRYEEMDAYNDCNRINDEEIKAVMDKMNNYVYSLFKEGQCTTTLLEMCDQINVVVGKWNNTVATQQDNMSEYVANMINYYTELHELYTTMQKNENKRRNPASIFNTVQVGIQTVTLSNENKSIRSSMF